MADGACSSSDLDQPLLCGGSATWRGGAACGRGLGGGQRHLSAAALWLAAAVRREREARVREERRARGK
jgi:hypothetical protein